MPFKVSLKESSKGLKYFKEGQPESKDAKDVAVDGAPALEQKDVADYAGSAAGSSASSGQPSGQPSSFSPRPEPPAKRPRMEPAEANVLDVFHCPMRELIKSNGRSSSIFRSSPTPLQGKGHTLAWHVAESGLEKKDGMASVLKRFNMFTYGPDSAASARDMWLLMAKSVKFNPTVHNDSIFVAAVESGYVVAYCKDDQRRVAIPDGVQDRYSQKATRKNERRVPELEILVNLFSLGTDQMSNITLAAVNDEPTALEVVAAVKDMGVDERQLHRIDAAMTLPGDRTPMQRALANGWGALTQVIQDEAKGKELTINVLSDMQYPRLSSYYSEEQKSWDSLNLKCEMYIVGDASGRTDTIPISKYFTDSLFRRRSLVIAGPRGLGKTWFAVAVAKEIAVMLKGPDDRLEDVVMYVVRTLQETKNCKLTEATPIVYDDIDLGQTMFRDAVPAEFMKNAVDVEANTTSLRLLGEWHTLPRCPKIFTTNCETLQNWCRLKSGGLLEVEHYEAVARRTLFVTYDRRLHSDAAVEQVDKDLATDAVARVVALAELRSSKQWS
jgi:hypothetical protein